jgi:hypothetical protein
MAEGSRVAAHGKQAADTVARETSESAQRVAEGQRRVVDALSEQSDRTFDAVSKANEIYRDAHGTHSEDVSALLNSYSTVAKGFQEIQRAWLETLQKSLQTGVKAPQMLRWSSFSEMAQSHRDLLRESMETLLEGNARVLRIAGRTAEEAARPIEGRARHTVSRQ